MKKYLWTGFLTVLLSLNVSAKAQMSFWSFNESGKEMEIPIQCDGYFDEARGGVFMPTPEELYEQGEFFLAEKGDAQNNAGYCFLSAALQGNTAAQLRVAQLYNRGVILPQNDLAAYKWAFIAALNGNKDAERLTLTLEQFLTTQDIELATQSVQSMLPAMTKKKTAELTDADEVLKQKKEELEKINKEIDNILGIQFVPSAVQKFVPIIDKKTDSINSEINEDRTEQIPFSDKESIFTAKDRMK